MTHAEPSALVTALAKTLPPHEAGMILVEPDGRAFLTPLRAPPTLQQLQSAVRGYVERVPLPAYRLAFCDEDGIAKKLPLNRGAVNYLNTGFRLFGPVVILIGVRVTQDGELALDPEGGSV